MNAAPASPKRAATCTACIRSIGLACAEVLPGDRGRRAHQPDRSPGDQREELRVRDREGRLRRRALRQRTDEREHHDSADVHRDSLNAGRQAEAEKRSDDGPVRSRSRVRAGMTRPSRRATA